MTLIQSLLGLYHAKSKNFNALIFFSVTEFTGRLTLFSYQRISERKKCNLEFCMLYGYLHFHDRM